jgi:putative flippase GtrA
MKFIIGFFKGRSKEFLEELFGCDMCLGFWVYLTLALLFQYANVDVNILDIPNAPIISAIITGAITSFVVHLISIGWRDKFGVYEIKGE